MNVINRTGTFTWKISEIPKSWFPNFCNWRWKKKFRNHYSQISVIGAEKRTRESTQEGSANTTRQHRRLNICRCIGLVDNYCQFVNLSICQFVNLSIWPQCLKILRAHRRAQPTQPDNIAVSTVVDVLVEEIILICSFLSFLKDFQILLWITKNPSIWGKSSYWSGKILMAKRDDAGIQANFGNVRWSLNWKAKPNGSI